MPSEANNYAGDGSYRAIGQEFLSHFVDIGRLLPGDRVLEIGSGLGRMALPLTAYLDRSGSYTGIEIVQAGAEWCLRHIAPLHPNFRFHRLDIRHPQYNPGGSTSAATATLDAPDAVYDFILLTSVFTHLDEGECSHYLDEIGRLLRIGGRCFATYFLIDDEARRAVMSGRSDQRFPFDLSGSNPAYMMPGDDSKAAVAFDAGWVMRRAAAVGLVPDGRLRRGTWTGRPGVSFQDIVVWRKIAAVRPSHLAVLEPEAAAILDSVAPPDAPRTTSHAWRQAADPDSEASRLAAATEAARDGRWSRLRRLSGHVPSTCLVQLIEAALASADPVAAAPWLSDCLPSALAGDNAPALAELLVALAGRTAARQALALALPPGRGAAGRLAGCAAGSAEPTVARFFTYVEAGAARADGADRGNVIRRLTASPPSRGLAREPALLWPELPESYELLVRIPDRSAFGDPAIWLNRQIRLQPLGAKARARKAAALLRLGDIAGSRRETRRAVCIDPARTVALEGELKVAEIAGDPNRVARWLAVLAPTSRFLGNRRQAAVPGPAEGSPSIDQRREGLARGRSLPAAALPTKTLDAMTDDPSSRDAAPAGAATRHPSEPARVIADIVGCRKESEVAEVLRRHGHEADFSDWAGPAAESLRLFGYEKLAKDAGRVAALGWIEDIIRLYRKLERTLGMPITPAIHAVATEIAVLRGARPKEYLVEVARELLSTPGLDGDRRTVDKAARLLRTVLDTSPGNYDAAFLLHPLLVKQGRSDAADEMVRDTIASLAAPHKSGTLPSKNAVRIARLEKLLTANVEIVGLNGAAAGTAQAADPMPTRHRPDPSSIE